MRVAFAGTPAFAERALRAIAQSGHEIGLVVTRPDSVAGRGMRATASAVKALALALGYPLCQPASLREEEAIARISKARAEILVVAAYGLLVPPQVLAIPPRGAINIHASLLPRWRGAAPIQRALMAGDRDTGISIMQMDAGLDTGPVLLQRRLAIEADDDFGSLQDRLAALGADAIVEALSGIVAGQARPVAQDASAASYAHKIERGETELDWRRAAAELERVVRALRPSPGARSTCRGEQLKLWRATCVPGDGMPGVVLSADEGGVLVACGSAALCVSELQRAGGRRLAAADFLRGFPIRPGECFGSAR